MKLDLSCIKVFLVLACAAATANAQEFPSGKIIRIVATQAGGGGDIVARLIAPELSSVWGQQVIIDNRSSLLANVNVAKSPPDGNTLLINSSSLWLWPLLRSDSPFDPLRDFTPVIWAIRQPSILVVPPSLPVKSVKELIAYAKARPGALNYSTGVVGATTHFAAELFKQMAGLNVVGVFYKGTAPAMNAVMSGEVQMSFPNSGSATGLIKAGKIRALGVTTAQPSRLVPGIPTISSSGLPGYDAETILGIFGPGGMQPALVKRLNADIERALKNPQVQAKLFGIGIEVVGGAPDALMGAVKGEIAKWGKLIKDVGIKLQ